MHFETRVAYLTPVMRYPSYCGVMSSPQSQGNMGFVCGYGNSCVASDA